MKYYWRCDCKATGEFDSGARILSLAESVRESRRLHGDALFGGVPNDQTCGDPDVVVETQEARETRLRRAYAPLGEGFC